MGDLQTAFLSLGVSFNQRGAANTNQTRSITFNVLGAGYCDKAWQALSREKAWIKEKTHL